MSHIMAEKHVNAPKNSPALWQTCSDNLTLIQMSTQNAPLSNFPEIALSLSFKIRMDIERQSERQMLYLHS